MKSYTGIKKGYIELKCIELVNKVNDSYLVLVTRSKGREKMWNLTHLLYYTDTVYLRCTYSVDYDDNINNNLHRIYNKYV